MSNVENILHTRTNAEITIHEHGANIMSFKPVVSEKEEINDEREVLFVSRESKAFPITGGIPIQFPIVTPFGPKDEMPEGGFLQHNNWHLDEDYKYDAKSDAAVQYSLPFDNVTNARGHGLWAAAEPGMVAYQADCVYNVKVCGPKMTAILSITNISRSRANTFPFQLLFHTYFKVANEDAMDPDECFVKGLEGYLRQDKADEDNKLVEEQSDEPVVLNTKGETHYCFEPKGHMSPGLDVIIGIGEGRSLQMTATCKVDDTELPVSCVVWNPHRKKASAMPSFGSAEWQEVIGVQPGILERQMLQPQQQIVFEYSIKLLAEDGGKETWQRPSMMLAGQTGPLITED